MRVSPPSQGSPAAGPRVNAGPEREGPRPSLEIFFHLGDQERPRVMRKSAPPRLLRGGAGPSLFQGTGTPGFTLVEILIVVAIIAVLASIAVPRYEAAVNNAKVIRTVCDLKTLSRAIEMYMLTNGRYPDSLAEVGYGERTDPWGHKYQYVNIQSKILNKLLIIYQRDKICGVNFHFSSEQTSNSKRCIAFRD